MDRVRERISLRKLIFEDGSTKILHPTIQVVLELLQDEKSEIPVGGMDSNYTPSIKKSEEGFKPI